ncbi:MAG: hypothetical protein ACFUZC_21140 [Chthoniobacteraceae bacterium]
MDSPLWLRWMKLPMLALALTCVASPLKADLLIPSLADTDHAEARKQAFIPWSTPDQGSDYWQKLSSNHVPIFKEFKEQGQMGRDLYIPNPGIGYWVLGGLSEKAFWRIHREKVKTGDELISAMPSEDENGVITYWALWAPAAKSFLLKDKMREFGITPAHAEVSAAGEADSVQRAILNPPLTPIVAATPAPLKAEPKNEIQEISEILSPYIGIAVFGILGLCLLLLAIGVTAVNLILQNGGNH